ncbi:MAG: hypothetical protein IPP36_13525 [Nitrosomonadales bacterium]|nr:hypothetical protein [Nitrosomonadales bacterium]
MAIGIIGQLCTDPKVPMVWAFATPDGIAAIERILAKGGEICTAMGSGRSAGGMSGEFRAAFSGTSSASVDTVWRTAAARCFGHHYLSGDVAMSRLESPMARRKYFDTDKLRMMAMESPYRGWNRVFVFATEGDVISGQCTPSISGRIKEMPERSIGKINTLFY